MLLSHLIPSEQNRVEIVDLDTGRCFLWHINIVLRHYNHKIKFQVIWTRLYGHQSNRDGGTLLQLRNILNRFSVPTDPKRDVNASEDFLQVLLIGHVVAAGMEIFGMKTMDDQPNDIFLVSQQLSRNQKEQVLTDVAHNVVSKFVNLDLAILNSNTTVREKKTVKNAVLEYAKECLTLCLLKAVR